MRVKLDRVFPLQASAAQSWRLLQDVEKVAACMPGAIITERIDESNYKGEINVKIGPATVAFKGALEVKQLDQEARRIQLVGKGSDKRGASTASMDLTANIRDARDTASELVGECEVVVNGKLASFGGRMMTQVSNQILQQFADNFAGRIEPGDEDAVADEEGAEETVSTPTESDHQLNAMALLWHSFVGMIKDWFRPKSKSSD